MIRTLIKMKAYVIMKTWIKMKTYIIMKTWIKMKTLGLEVESGIRL